MSGGYTPGPWSIHTEREHNIYASYSVYICCEGEWPEGQLARVNVMDGLGEREANARLIAAAPELLDALRGVLEDAHEEAYPAARALISRIEGESV